MNKDAAMNAGFAGIQERPFSYLMDADKRHRIWIVLLSALGIAATIAIIVYGWNYYILDQAHRPLSPKHALLKPSGTIGLRLGMLGLGLFAIVYLYPIRKHWPWLGQVGQTKRWLDFHILVGLIAPAAITFHSAFKLQGIAGMAYWAMVVLTVSGLIGRYFYAQLPQQLGAAEISLKEMQGISAQLTRVLNAQKIVPAWEIARVFRFPAVEEVREMPIIKALLIMLKLDLARPIHVSRLRRRYASKWDAYLCLGGLLRTGMVELEAALMTVSNQAVLSKKILFLSITHRLFRLWHLVHRPFGISFALFVIIHIAVVMSLGYF